MSKENQGISFREVVKVKTKDDKQRRTKTGGKSSAVTAAEFK